MEYHGKQARQADEKRPFFQALVDGLQDGQTVRDAFTAEELGTITSRIQDDECLAAGINADFPSFGHRWLNGAMEAGLGDQDISALIKTLRPA